MVSPRHINRLGLFVALTLVAGALAMLPAGQARGQEEGLADHLLVTEVLVTPTAAEFVEVHNPTGAAIELTDVYLTDATFAPGNTFYYNTVTGNGGGGGFGDFNARFPAGSTIGAGEYQTISLTGSEGYAAAFGAAPDYELFEDGAGTDGVPDMLEATPGSINGQGGLSDSGEVVILYSWDGSSNLVEDLDYFVWGDKNEAVDKTGVTVGGSTYKDDVAVALQAGFSATEPHGEEESAQRRDLTEGDETASGGNGTTGNDETSENLPITWGVAAPTPGTATTLEPPIGGPGAEPGPLPRPGKCGDGHTPVYDIQGPGDASPLENLGVASEGVVTAVLDGLGGFSIQDAKGDGDAATSDGIWVDHAAVGSAGAAASSTAGASPTTTTTKAPPAGGVALKPGDRVRVVGHVEEFFELTQLTSLTDDPMTVLFCDAGDEVTPTDVAFPLPAGGDFERLEGMLVGFDELTATDNFNLSRFGEVELAGSRLRIPTDVVRPGSQNAQLQDRNDRSRIVLDDASAEQNPVPVPYLGDDGTLRLGEKVTNLAAIVHCNFGCHKLEPVGEVEFSGNPRPDAPAFVGGRIEVASFNVLNYWTTLDDGTNPGARGADSAEELERQTAKLVAAINSLGADIIALQELENNGPDAIGALVAALNAAGPGEWAAVPDPDYPGGLESTNAIKVGIIYRSDRVTPRSGPLVSTDPAFALDRPPVAMRFGRGGQRFTVVSNHFKSKSCTNTSPGDPFPEEADIGDGQACFNPRRTRQAEALLEFVGEIQSQTNDADVLVVGDLNAYAMEDPIRALRDGGLVDLTASVSTDDRYTLTFFGQTGQLDYAFATPSLAEAVAGVDIVHWNTDEPPFLDYNTEFKPPGSFVADQFRSSDHDIVLVGINGAEPAQLPRTAIAGVEDALRAMLPTGDVADDDLIRRAAFKARQASDPENWVGDSNVIDGLDAFRKMRTGVTRLESVSTVDVDAEIATLRAAARETAVIQLFLAEQAGGAPGWLANVRARLILADSTQDPSAAIGLYRLVWRGASGAMDSRARIGTFNASLNRGGVGQLVADLATPTDNQAQAVAEILQRSRPAAVLINEFDFDEAGDAARLFQENYLSVSQNGAEPIVYPFVYVAPSNTGIPSGFDLDNDGAVGGPNDAFGFGFFEGQFGMAVFSMYPIHTEEVRTFQHFLWKDMPDALLPDDPATPASGDWYSEEELEVFRLSSKSHWDIPLLVGREVVHLLASHPTPPVFDGPEDRNGTRNHDEIRFWADYVDPARSGYIYDDDGGTGGLSAGDKFVVVGDLNADPLDGDSTAGAANQLTDHPLVNTSITPSSVGGPEQSALQGGANEEHVGDPAFDTADFADTAPGNLRVDYALPSATTTIRTAGVFWPLSSDPLFRLVGTFPFPSSDHRHVWVVVDTR